MASPIVTISDGKLKGKEWEIVNGEHVVAFLGIPYGKPPIGDLRFKAPKPAEPWEGIRDATKDGDPCYSRNFLTQKLEGSEDCLSLNVYTKSLQPVKPRPVMVFIHGGAFVGGSNKSELYNPDYLLLEDVVLVVINYRLGILGFLQLDDPVLEIPGNAGLKDQVLALEWVKKNIAHFGGDPNNVTIFGESAGSASVHYHILSPSSKGLFHKAILQSGTVHNPWPYGTAKLTDVLALKGLKVTDEKSGLDHLMKMNVEELYALQKSYMTSKTSELRIFGPTVEKPNPTGFITKEPVEILASGDYNKVPMMIGYCDKEALIFLSKAIRDAAGMPADYIPTLEDQVALFMGLDKESPAFKPIIERLHKAYIDSGMKYGELLLHSDLLFIAGIITSAKLHTATSTEPVYLYRFSVETGLNFCKQIANAPTVEGASHGDDLGYLFRANLPNMPTPQLEKGSLEEKAVKVIVQLWTNFAERSNPTPVDCNLGVAWTPAQKNALHFMEINRTLSIGCNPEKERYAVWQEVEDLYKAHGITISGT